jgi:ComF family protein
VKQLLNDFVALFYPEVCLCCGESLAMQEEFVCTMCVFKLPRTNYHKLQENPIQKVFWGRVEVDNVSAFCHYQKGNTTQDLVHEMKYKDKKELGTSLGKWYGTDLKDSNFAKAEVIIPVPLHPRKLRRRGYNQSQYFAEGLSDILKIPVMADGLIRVKDTETQTRKSRFSRWENVEGIFNVNKPDELKGKHVLLVDDIITTGSTVEACVMELRKADIAAVSVVAIGCADTIGAI